MTKEERNFLNEIKGAIDDWSFSYNTYHNNGCFCIDIDIDDMDEWGENADEIWDALSEVCNEWDAGIDSWDNHYEIALEL